MEEKKTFGIKQEKLSYEELEKVAVQLQQQLMQMKQRLEALDATSLRLSFLFKVLEHVEVYPEPFILKVTEEVMDILTIPEETKEKKENKQEEDKQ